MRRFHSLASLVLSSVILLIAMSVSTFAQETPRNLAQEMRDEYTWAQSELWAIEKVREDPESARLEMEKVELEMNRFAPILPFEPEVEEWFETMKNAGERCGSGVLAYGPESISHERFEELRLVLDLQGEPSSIECFRQRIRNRPRTSSWTELPADGGIRKVQLSVFFAPLPDPRPCRTFEENEVNAYLARQGEMQRVMLRGTYEGLKEKCAELEKDPAARSIAHRRTRAINHIGLMGELQQRFEPEEVE
jgi:hypothetical protein